jgi:hypothetical protein
MYLSRRLQDYDICGANGHRIEISAPAFRATNMQTILRIDLKQDASLLDSNTMARPCKTMSSEMAQICHETHRNNCL